MIKIKKSFFLFIVISFNHLYSFDCPGPSHIEYIIDNSEWITFGSISEVKDNFFIFQPDTIFKGPIKLEFDLLKNKEFVENENYMGPVRFKKYEKGDSLILFIEKDQYGYSIISGCYFDREIHYEKGYLYFYLLHSARMYHEPGKIPERWKNEGMERIEMGLKIKYADFKRNLENYLMGEPSAFFIAPEISENITKKPNKIFNTKNWIVVGPVIAAILGALLVNYYAH